MSHLKTSGLRPLLSISMQEAVDRSADLYGDSIGFISPFQGIKKTFLGIRNEAKSIGLGLLSLGLGKGDRLGIWTPNCYESYLTFLGAGSVGLVVVCLNPALQAPELKEALAKVKPKALLISRNQTHQDFHSIAFEVLTNLNQTKGGIGLKWIISCDKNHKSTTYFWDLIKTGSAPDPVDPPKSTSPSLKDPCCILFTSGTTGSPKAITHSHASLISKGHASGLRLGVERGQRLAIPLPLFHLYGIHSGLITPLLFGATTVLTSYGYDASLFANVIQTERCTHVYLTPTMLLDLENSGASFKDLKGIVSAGSSCPEHIWEKAISLWPGVELLTLYGTTETGTVFSCKPGDSPQTALSTVGYPLDHSEIKLIDEFGRLVALGEKGELCVKMCDPEGQVGNVLDQERWCHTGDIFVLRADGYGSFIQRQENVIDRGSEKISPMEVENLLRLVPGVLDAMVYGVPDSRLGEAVAACIKAKDIQDQSAFIDEIRKYCKGRLAHFKTPKYFLVCTEFPKTALGKVDKSKMRLNTMEKYGL